MLLQWWKWPLNGVVTLVSIFVIITDARPLLILLGPIWLLPPSREGPIGLVSNFSIFLYAHTSCILLGPIWFYWMFLIWLIYSKFVFWILAPTNGAPIHSNGPTHHYVLNLRHFYVLSLGLVPGASQLMNVLNPKLNLLFPNNYIQNRTGLNKIVLLKLL